MRVSRLIAVANRPEQSSINCLHFIVYNYYITDWLIDMEYPVVLKDFISASDAELVISFIDQLHRDGKLHHSSMENGIDGRNLIWNPDDKEAIELIKKYTKKVIEAQGENLDVFIHVCGFYKYEKNSGMGPHSDIMNEGCSKCILSAVLYFNDEYLGGELFFPKLNKEFRMPARSVAFYPAHLPQYDHGVREITSGVRYAIPMCFTTDFSRSPQYYN